ncbi:hypothetical protein [Tomitella fengzijianii]|uniref:Uncharacterized protein n=1 Tax=Tomitella fengzijianii TaxID=2597660 RepID=A0A516X244_9ACTN|nr:hypothetical protein [Tomitella fengzijianii]QDQ97152.1 hypothetical protein FO059_07155 [Tomitella fengzijianii]
MHVSSWNRNAGLIAGAVAAVALTVTGCSSGDGGDAAAASVTSAPAAPSESGTPEPPATWTPATVPSGPPAPAPAPGGGGQAGGAPGGGEQGDGGQDGGAELTRDQATEQLKRLLGDPKDAQWEGDTLRVTMSWGSADIEGMDGVCQGAQMILQQYTGTLTMDFPDGTTRTCTP